jgi:Zn-dependent peptidase ImmA (M78 family)
MYSRKSIDRLACSIRSYLCYHDSIFSKAPYLSSEKIHRAIEILKGRLCLNPLGYAPASEATIQTFNKEASYAFNISLTATNHPIEDIFEVAHQIGHLFIHLKYGSSNWKDNSIFNDTIAVRSEINATDYEAYFFAACFMMPSQEFLDQLHDENRNTKELSSFFAVPETAILFKMNDIKIS